VVVLVAVIVAVLVTVAESVRDGVGLLVKVGNGVQVAVRASAVSNHCTAISEGTGVISVGSQ